MPNGTYGDLRTVLQKWRRYLCISMNCFAKAPLKEALHRVTMGKVRGTFGGLDCRESFIIENNIKFVQFENCLYLCKKVVVV